MVKRSEMTYGTVNLVQLQVAFDAQVASVDDFFKLIAQTRGPEEDLFKWMKKKVVSETHVIAGVSATKVNGGYLQWTAQKLAEAGIDLEHLEYEDEDAWRDELSSWQTM